ncbi:ciliary-associated calcium-binding coiled-coil protein 1-like isoform X2 [Lineus longissimus]|uniref:ciliary-associated calcium-binding coiled-coil protein 1-like isoform X2 n=1 Tax=Lineus longissimus TaxID=88925 RepID=UPI002B4F7FFE
MSRRVKRKQTKVQDDGEKGAFAYKVLSEAQTKDLLELTVEEVEGKLGGILNITDQGTDLKNAATLDFFTGGFWWAKEQGYNIQQASGFFTLIHTLLENVKDKQMTMVDNLKQFKKSLAGIGQDAPEVYGGMEFFDINQAKAVSDFVYMSFFQHYHLYEFVYGHSQAEEIIGTDLEIEVPKAADMPWPPPLDEGVSEEVYNTFIATPPPTPVPEPTEEESEEVCVDQGETDADREAALFSNLSPEEVKRVLESVCKEVLAGVEADVASKLRDKEIAFVTRINKIHKVAD